MTKANGNIRLSPTSGLNLYNDCKRCFWLQYNQGAARPRGIFPSLPGGMDLVIKKYFDNYRGSLPPELKGKIKGNLLSDLNLMNLWRNWRTGLEYHDKTLGAMLFGALDECLIYSDVYVPLDYKTKGSAPRDGDSERYYQTQLDSYALLLSCNGYPSADFAYLVYYYPLSVKDDGVVKFAVEPVEIKVNPERVKKLFEEAVNCIAGVEPAPAPLCEYCNFENTRRKIVDSRVSQHTKKTLFDL